MISMLLGYDSAGNVVETLDYMLARDAAGNVIGLVDFGAHELAGGKMRDIFFRSDLAGAGTWPEWIGARAHDFTVELGPDKRIVALVHKKSGFRRARAAIEAAIGAAPVLDGSQAGLSDQIRDLRAILGGPTMPLILDDAGHTIGRSPAGTPAHLPIVGLTS